MHVLCAIIFRNYIYKEHEHNPVKMNNERLGRGKIDYHFELA